MSDVLTAIVAGTRRSAAERAKSTRAAVERQAAFATPQPESFLASLEAPGVRIIAECKRRSPSRGILRADYDPAAIASGYKRAGAAAISVLTEPSFFDGDLEHLRAVRAAVSLPIIRKDFITTEFQVVEARAAGADAALLIVAALTESDLASMIATTRAHGMAALVEAHTVAETQRAIDAGATIIGVNSRNLRTLSVSAAVFDEIAPLLPAGVVAVAESGISTASDIRRLRQLGYRACLIGERFMSSGDPGAALEALLRDAEAES